MLWCPPPGFQNIMWRFVSYRHPLLHPEHWKTLVKDSYCSGQPFPFWNLLSVCQLPALTFSLTSHGLAAEKRTGASLIPPLKKQLCSLYCVFRELIKCANPTPKCLSVCYDVGSLPRGGSEPSTSTIRVVISYPSALDGRIRQCTPNTSRLTSYF